MMTFARALWFLPVVLVLSTAAFASSFSGRVVGVTDGDGLKVLRAGREVKIRLYGIDAPERRQAFGERAKQYASDLAFGREVVVQQVDRDRYGRPVAWVLLPDGRSLNQEMVRAGFAWWYRQYAKANRELESLETAARAERRGLWKDPDPVPPWEFRRQQRRSTQPRPKTLEEWFDARP